MGSQALVSRPLSTKQVTAAQMIRDGLAAGQPLCADLLIESHLAAYGLGNNRKRASTYSSHNLQREAFVAEIHLDRPETRRILNLTLWQCLLGTHPIHPGDKRLMTTALRLLGRLLYPESRKATRHKDEFADRSVDDLEHFATFGRWPDSRKLN